jgi:hypothetical protein
MLSKALRSVIVRTEVLFMLFCPRFVSNIGTTFAVLLVRHHESELVCPNLETAEVSYPTYKDGYLKLLLKL